MDQKRPAGTTFALGLSMFFGLGVALLAMLGVPFIGVVAGIGGLAVGAVWIVISLRGDRGSTRI